MISILSILSNNCSWTYRFVVSNWQNYFLSMKMIDNVTTKNTASIIKEDLAYLAARRAFFLPISIPTKVVAAIETP